MKDPTAAVSFDKNARRIRIKFYYTVFKKIDKIINYMNILTLKIKNYIKS